MAGAEVHDQRVPAVGVECVTEEEHVADRLRDLVLVDPNQSVVHPQASRRHTVAEHVCAASFS
jgi:hypothetical protein